MHFLRRISAEIPGLTGFVERVCSNPITQGVIVDLNPIWLFAYRLMQAGLDVDAAYYLFAGYARPYQCWPLPFEDLLENDLSDASIDIYWKHALVDDLSHVVFNRKPAALSSLLVKVIASPITDPELAGRRRELINAVRETAFPAIVQTRPSAHFVVSPGDPCSTPTGNSGTIGGFLNDKNTGDCYAATCGHVVSAGNVSVHGKLLGTCKHSAVPKALSSGQVCDPKSKSLNRLDIALINIGTKTVTNTSSNVATTIYPRESITSTGGVTGRNQYEVGGVAIVYAVGGICFDNLFEVRPPAPTGLISAKLKAAVATVPQSGDSGAWVERTGAPDWCGVLVAADHLMGYAMESDSVIAEANSRFGMKLALV